MRGAWFSGVTVLLVALLAVAESYKVLVVFPLPGKSHSLLGEAYVKLLLKRGHEVTYITPFPMKMESANFTQVVTGVDMSGMKGHEDLMNIESLLKGSSVLLDDFGLPFMSLEMSKMALMSEGVQNFLRDPKQRFDVVVAEWFYTEIYSAFAAFYKCPLVWSSSMDVHSMILRVVDESPNTAYTPDVCSFARPPFTFQQRVQELYKMLKKNLLFEFVLVPKSAEVYKQAFGDAAATRGIELPPYEEIIYSASMTLANSHPSLGEAPKLAQNIKEVGGYHIEPKTEPLPKNLQKIIEQAKHGVIYFSMGSNVKSKDMPAQMKRDLLKMLGELKQTVLWKFEESAEGVPSNVHIQSWMPQHSILAHPNVKLFITHGGLLSTTETVHYGVPIIAIPLFGDQFLNAESAEKRGFAVTVKFTYNLANDLRTAIKEAIENPSYAIRSKQLSSIYHDRPLAPAEELLYWIEYAVRTGGAPHLRSPALLVPWYQKLYLDLIALILVALVTVLVVLKKLCRKICKNSKMKTD